MSDAKDLPALELILPVSSRLYNWMFTRKSHSSTDQRRGAKTLEYADD